MTAPREPYGLNIGRFMEDYGPRWIITAGPHGEGYAARRRGTRVPAFRAMTLDQLADILDREESTQ